MGNLQFAGFYFLVASAAFINLCGAMEFYDDNEYGKIIGIDFGESHARVAVMQEYHVEVLINEAGSRSTPCYVAFTDEGTLVGEAARKQAAANPNRTIFDFRRMMGVDFRHPDVQTTKDDLPYSLIEEKGRIHIQVNLDNSLKSFSLEAVASSILADLKQTAESYLGEKVTHAVITAPGYFNEKQRRAIKDAGALAGLTVLRILNESTAAAIAYEIDKGRVEEVNVLVFDLGGRTLSVAVSLVERGVFELLATAKDTRIGGDQINQRIRHYLIDQFNSEHTDAPFPAGDFNRLGIEIEKAKRALSSSTFAPIEMKGLDNGHEFSEVLRRETFEELNMDLFEKSLELVGEVLEESRVTKEDIGEIILAGGSSYIPKIQRLIEAYFGGKRVLQGKNPDEIFCIGAAIQGDTLSWPLDNYSFFLIVNDLSFGIGTTGGLMHKIIPRNMAIPTQKRQIFSTTVDNQSAIMIDIYRGERVQVARNYHLGTLNLTGIPPAPRGVPEIEVIFTLDLHGQLNVTATDLGSGKTVSLVVWGNTTDISEVERHIQKAMEYYEQDMATLEAVEEELGLQNLTHSLIDPPPEYARLDGPAHNEL